MDHDRSVADAALEVAASASAAKVSATEAHTAAEVGPASSARVAPAAEAAGRAGASPAAVGPSEQLADEEAREESGAAERHEIPARPGAEVGRGIPVRHPPSSGHHLA